MMRPATVLICAIMAGLFANAAWANCRQALALGLDISGSVDAQEYRLQLDGLAGALTAPSVRAALLAMPGAPVDIAVYEWSGPENQTLVLPWTTLNTSADITRAAAILTRTTRSTGDPSTALGAALAYGSALMAQRPGCWRHVLDISGDGTSNTGPRPQDIREILSPLSLTINGLAIGTGNAASGDRRQMDIKELSSYFRANVIKGPNAFVETAIGFNDYRDAMERKLLRELKTLAIGGLTP